MFSAAVETRLIKSQNSEKSENSENLDFWMMKHATPKPIEDSTLLMTARFFCDHIAFSVKFQFFLEFSKKNQKFQFFNFEETYEL